MFGILVKVLLSRRLLEDAGPADFGVELDLPLSTTRRATSLAFSEKIGYVTSAVKDTHMKADWTVYPLFP